MGLYDPCQNKGGTDCKTAKCHALEILDDVVFAYFAIEMVIKAGFHFSSLIGPPMSFIKKLIKMIAMGVWGKLGYLGDSWNRLDCFIVIAGALEYCLHLDNMNLTAIRTIRVLRPLRAINRVPSMRILVMLLLGIVLHIMHYVKISQSKNTITLLCHNVIVPLHNYAIM